MRPLWLLLLLPVTAWADVATYPLTLRRQREKEPGRFIMEEAVQNWNAQETAVILCDVWDSHHSKNAADRTAELAPRMNDLAELARLRGSLIIHAPSDCMKSYEGHPARERAKTAPPAANLPSGIDKWLHWKDAVEEKIGYPIDATDGGQDDTPDALKNWHEQLASRGRNPKAPWLKEIETIRIDPDKDAISDSGVEIWNLLESRGIKNVLLFGVHTNMCVLGRPFGLRQLSKHGKNVVLVRDLTDTMYNPALRPQVSHFEGTELIISHIERHVCPTVSSDQLLGGAPFHFAGDSRPSLLMIIGEDEYRTAETLPEFAATHLTKQFRTTFSFDHPNSTIRFPGLEALRHANVLLVSVRRRPLPDTGMKWLREYIASGRPLVGIRTASHAWALKGATAVPNGFTSWPEWDAEVLGGNYQNHYGNDQPPKVTRAAAADHPILQGLPFDQFQASGSLYKNTPLREGTHLLLVGTLPDGKSEPVAWTFQSKSGNRVFYTSLGHEKEFKSPFFQKLLSNGLRWAAAKDSPR